MSAACARNPRSGIATFARAAGSVPLMTGRIRVGVIGIEHLHLFEMVDGLVRAGAEVAAVDAEPGPLLDLFGGWQPEARRVDRSAMLGDDSIDVIVLAGVPADRASVAVEALRAGKHVFAAKPAVTTAADLALVDAAATEHHRRWWVFFSERLTNRAVIEAVRLCGAGAIGRVVAVSGSAPHTLAAPTRPPWFFDTRRAGGILTDLAAHQADQFLSLAGPGTWEVTGALAANLATPDHPDFCDLGRFSIRHTRLDGTVVVGHHHVDWLSPAGLGTWGDVRLTITGAEGSVEVRSNIDVCGHDGAEHLLVVDGSSARRVDCSAVVIDWADRLIAEVRGGPTFLPHSHVVDACRVAIAAQCRADANAPAPGGGGA